MNTPCRTALGLVMLLGMAQGVAGQPATDAAPGPTQDGLAEAVRLGEVATLAPICGLRNQRWAADLRRSAIQSATGSHAQGDRDLAAAPGSNLVVGALSFAEAEALESFAEAPAKVACGQLRNDPDLGLADERVERFRKQAGPADPAS